MYAATASIVHEDSYQAGREAVEELLDEMASTPDLVMLFATSEHEPQRVMDGIWSQLPDGVRLIGCSSFAEIGGEDAMTGSVTVMGIVFGPVLWGLYQIDEVGASSTEAGRKLGRMIADLQPRVVIAFPDGLVANSMKFVNGMQSVLGSSCPIVGGLASEALNFEHTYQFLDRRAFSGGAVALALGGPITVVTSAGSGFQPVGVVRTCTEVVDDKFVHSLDGESALELYKAFLGDDVLGRPNIGLEFPLAVISGAGGDFMASDERSQVIRAVRQLDEQRGALVCAGDIYQGAKVRMTRATKNDLITAAASATERASRELPDASLCLLFNCAGRKIILGAKYQKEIESAFAVLDSQIPRIGFYTYGEIAPVDGANMYHDETFTLVLLGMAA